MDLDIKEAYEFSVLNPFLINEEELDKVTKEAVTATGNGGLEDKRGTGGGGLELHGQGNIESEEERSIGGDDDSDNNQEEYKQNNPRDRNQKR